MGSLSPPSCQAVRTPQASHRAAVFLAAVMPPVCETRLRTKSMMRSEMSGVHSLRADEEFAHGEGCGGDALHTPKPVDLLRREQVFEEEQLVGFQALCEFDAAGCREVLVDIVQQLHLLPSLTRRCSKSLGMVRMYSSSSKAAPENPWRDGCPGRAGSCLRRRSRPLGAHVAVPLLHVLLDIFLDVVHIAPIGVGIHWHRIARPFRPATRRPACRRACL